MSIYIVQVKLATGEVTTVQIEAASESAAQTAAEAIDFARAGNLNPTAISTEEQAG